MFSLQGSSTVMDNGSLTTQPPIGLYQVYTFVWSKSFEACHCHQVPDGWYVAPGLGWGGLRKENASDDNIERVLLILTLLISGSGKRARFRGKYCYLGAPMGTPGVPDGRYVAPGLGWGGLRKENASDDNIDWVLLILKKDAFPPKIILGRIYCLSLFSCNF